MASPLNRIASTLWSSASAVSRRAAELGWIRAERLDSRIVSIGNLQAGGAGKTPLVRLLASEALARNKTVCILIRGYRGEWEREGGIIEPGESPADPSLCGDEASLLHDRLPRAWIGVGADRASSFRRVVARAGRSPDLTILDDGFQNRRILKDLEIVAVTSRTRYESVFRDFESQLLRADLVVWTKGDRQPETRGRPWARTRFELPKDTSGGRYWLVSGLADNEDAAKSIARASYRIEKHLSFKDHAQYDPDWAHTTLEAARNQGCRIALTGKDWVKWRQLGIRESQVRVLEPELIFERGREEWDRVLWES